MMMRETKLAWFLLLLGGGLAATTSADASVSVALSIDDVARASVLVARVVPIEQTSAWEDGRIVTSTRLRVERVVAGTDGVTSEVRVRTLGGIIDNVGQTVEGEARFAPNVASIVFLGHRDGDVAPSAPFIVAGRAQGQLVVSKDARNHEIVRVAGTGALVQRPQRVPYALPNASQMITMLDGRDAADVTREAARAWERTHAR
jgi:hypothetical protein